jgi:hypothetical protein
MLSKKAKFAAQFAQVRAALLRLTASWVADSNAVNVCRWQSALSTASTLLLASRNS